MSFIDDTDWFEPMSKVQRPVGAEWLPANEAGYRGAAAAAERACTTPSAEATAWQRHVVNLAATEPAVTVVWLADDTRVAQLVRPVVGVAIDKRAIFVEPLCGRLEDYLTALHELGHCRTVRNGSRLRSEHDAWLFARSNALCWPAAAQRNMTASLNTYLRDITLADITDVHRIERLCSTLEYQRERQRRVQASLNERR
jgi:hypothetical protein